MIPVPKERRKGNGKAIKVTGASENNLKMSVLNFRWVNLLLSQAFQVQGKYFSQSNFKKRLQKLNRNSNKPGNTKASLVMKPLKRLLTLTKVQLVEHQEVIQRLILVFLMTFAICLPKQMKPRFVAIKRSL